MTRADRKAKFTPPEVFSNPLGETAEDIFRQAKVAAAKTMPLCAPATRALRPIFLDDAQAAEAVKGTVNESNGRFTMGVDPYFRVYVANKFVFDMVKDAQDVSATNPCGTCGATSHHNLAYLAGVIGHEAWHLIRKHSKRIKAAGFSNPKRWNTAADLELNDDLISIYTKSDRPRLCLPPWCAYPKRYRDIPSEAKLWVKNPHKKQVEAVSDPKERAVLLDTLPHATQSQYGASEAVKELGEDIWKQFTDGRLAEEYYLSLPVKECPVHGDPDNPNKKKDKSKSGDNKEKGDKGEKGPKGEKGDKGEQGDEGEGGDEHGDGGGQGEGDGHGDGDGHSHGHGGGACTCEWTTDHGSGVDGVPRSYEQGPPTAENPGISEVEGRAISREVAKKISEASKSRGDVPAGMSRWAEGELEPPKYNWRQELAKAVRYGSGRKHGSQLRTYRRLGILTGSTHGKILFPMKYDPVPNVTCVLDTSGSMCDKALRSGLTEIDGVIKALGGNIRFTSVDAAASELMDVRNVRDVRLTGGGGTDMRVGIQAALSDPNRVPSVIIVLTDGYTPWPEEPINQGKTTLIICLVGEGTADLASVPAWALGIKIEGENVTKKEVQ